MPGATCSLLLPASFGFFFPQMWKHLVARATVNRWRCVVCAASKGIGSWTARGQQVQRASVCSRPGACPGCQTVELIEFWLAGVHCDIVCCCVVQADVPLLAQWLQTYGMKVFDGCDGNMWETGHSSSQLVPQACTNQKSPILVMQLFVSSAMEPQDHLKGKRLRVRDEALMG